MQTLTKKAPSQNGEKEINEELKKEAEFFSDIVIVPFMDSYDLVVLKTIAIAEYGVGNWTLLDKYIIHFLPCFNLIDLHPHVNLVGANCSCKIHNEV